MFSRAASMRYMAPEELREWMLARRDHFKVVDVRDEDFVGGHIPGALNYPSENFIAEEFLDTLVGQLSGHEVVVFHCMKSQVRGPTCASRYQAALSRADNPTEQQVLVLQGGFERWDDLYRTEAGMVATDEAPET